jgi:hypothetical protein
MWGVSIDANERVWIGTSAGLLMFGPRGWRAWQVTGGAPAANPVTALADDDGQIWLAVTDPSGIGLSLTRLDLHGTPDDTTDDTTNYGGLLWGKDETNGRLEAGTGAASDGGIIACQNLQVYNCGYYGGGITFSGNPYYIRGNSNVTAREVYIYNIGSAGAKFGINKSTGASEALDVAGTVRATGYKSSDGTAGLSDTKTFYSPNSNGTVLYLNTVTIKNGLITAWTQE